MTSAPEEGSPNSPRPRPPKKGEPWPKRFTFTPDGAMRFVKNDARPQRRPGPGRKWRDDGPRPPYGRGGEERDFRGPPRRPKFGDRPEGNDRNAERPSSWNRRTGEAPRRNESRPEWNRRGPVPRREPGAASSGKFPAPERSFRAPDRPQFQASFRKPPRPDPEERRFSDRPRESSRPGRDPRVTERVTGRIGPRDRNFDKGAGRRPLPRPQSGVDAPPQPAPDPKESAPASRDQLAARILERATATIPADLLLRQTLARRRQLSRADGAWISRAVFSVFRWRGWLDTQAPTADRIARALALADDFAISPAGISDEDLVAKAVPAWVADHFPVTPEWTRSLQAEPFLWIRTRPGMRDAVLAQLDNAEPASWRALEDALRYDGQDDLYRHPLFQSGAFEIQDIASQAVGHVCAPQAGETWWDACAGEGGKTLHLSALMGGKGLIWSSDRAAWRLARLKQRAARAGCFNYRGVDWNGGPRTPTRTRFDGILVDAPCSGLGTWGRNPHARWTATPDDVRELADLQRNLLHHAAPSLKPGGRLVYAVCTLTPAETTGVVEGFSAAHPEFEVLPLAHPFAPGSEPQASLTLWPQDTQGNGMFIAGWRRKA